MMNNWSKQVFWGALAGAAIGVLLGLGLARLLWPPAAAPAAVEVVATPAPSPQPTSSPRPPTLVAPSPDPEHSIVVVSALYALDGDLDRARERLTALDLEAGGVAVAELARRYAEAGNRQVATDLATLAAALGERDADLLAYVATATATATTIPPTPTATASATPLPSPTPSPIPTDTPSPTPTPTRAAARRSPTPTSPPPTPAATRLPLEWDYRASTLEPPVRHVRASVPPGQPYWRLVRLEWRKASEGGNTLLYVTVLDEQGQPVWGQPVIIENGGHTFLYTEPKPGESHGVNFPMSSTLNSYQAFVGGDLPSDRVTGMGLGEYLGGLDHTSFILVFQRTRD